MLNRAPSPMKQSWKERWWDIRDTIIENLEEFLTAFWEQGVKRAWHPAKALLGLGVILIAGVLMIHNWLSDGPEESPPVSAPKPPEYREPSPPAEIQPDSDVQMDPSTEEEDSGFSQQDQKAMKELGIAFVREYTTYHDRDLKERAERIRPYVSKDIYQTEKKAAKDVPDNIPSESRFDKVTQIRVQSRSIREGGAAQMIWLGTVYSVIDDDQENKERIQLTLVPHKDGWKVAEVIYH
ncbi:hypothetical protein GCM10007416_33980 [Kroppenstedtia guangzhouensis]|uniref:Uncharacterized protein n=2 Tax=Kroppenstedtia guangzhouensis TaxID=1274356 RepID=A0ABQ1H3Z2_9BACL|nr:hypothetical protein GCM10007416_33980 [Kroppenstedtia guangzhouensis]